MSSLVRNIQRSALRSKRADNPITPYKGRGSKLGFKTEAKPAPEKKAPRGSRRGTNKMRGPFGKGGAK
jgi:hypothetical protein